ncbi:MAG: hypothetical protein R3B84_09780 [Zavarzinella sp.]
MRNEQPPLIADVEYVYLTRLGSPDADRTIPPDWWHNWLGDQNPSTAVWLLDGVDEAIDSNQYVLQRIVEEINAVPNNHLRQLRLILFSRPYAELGSLKDQLIERYQSLTGRTRLPQLWLTRLDRTSASALVGTDQIGAVEELILRNHLQSVAGYPVVLNFLKTYQREANTLTVAKVWRGVLTALLGEPQSNRMVRFATNPAERFNAACRVAAVLTLTRRETIREWSPDTEEPTIGVLFQFPDNRSHIAAKDACQSALFSTSGDPVRYRFVQQNAQDWLTAFALKDLPQPALKSLLQGHDGKMPFRLREIARLLMAVTTDQATKRIIELLSGGILLPSDAVEPSLVEVIRAIDYLEELATASPWGLRASYERPEELARLRAEGLGRILADRLRDVNRPYRVKMFLIDVAEATQAIEAVDAVVEIVLDQKQEGELRYSAMWMVTRYGGKEHIAALLGPIAESSNDSEIECRIRGVLIWDLLNRNNWPCWQVALYAPRINPRLLDIRSMILHYLEDRITLDDARHILPHLRELWQRHADEHRPDELPKYLFRAVELVLNESHPDQDDINHLLDFVRENLSDDMGWSASRTIIIHLRQLISARRRMYQIHLEAGQFNVGNLLEPEDWSWLRDQALSGWNNRTIWYQVLWLATQAKENGQISDDKWQTFIQLVDEHAPGLRAEDEEGRLRFQQEREADAAKQQEAEARDPNRRPLAERVSQILANSEISAPELMRQLSWMCLANFSVNREIPGNSLRDLPSELQNQVMEALCKGLEVGEPTTIPQSGNFPSNILSEGAAFAQVIGSVNHANWLTEELIRRWLPTTLFARMSGGWAEPITACSETSSVATETALLKSIELHARREGIPSILREILPECWTDNMTNLFVQLIADERVRPNNRRELLEQLVTRSPDRAKPIVDVWAMYQVTNDDSDHLRQAGLNLLLALNPDQALDLIEADFASRGSLSLEELPYLWNEQDEIANHWSLSQLESLGRILLKAYLSASDPDYRDGELPPDWELRNLRNRIIMQLLNNSGEGAMDAVNRLSELDPKIREWVDSHSANQQAAQFLPGINLSISHDSSALSVQDAVRILDRAGYRLIRSPDDLLDAVIEALGKIQHDVDHDLPMLYSAPDRGMKAAKGRKKADKSNRSHLEEDALQAYLRRRLLDELSRISDGIEVQILREDQVAGRQRLDLRVTAPRHGSSSLATVVVEVKWSTNHETRSGLVEQLGKRYLVGEGLTHGVFLVGWSGEWHPHDGTGANTSLETLESHLNSQRDKYCAAGQPGEKLRIEPFILNIPWSRPPV